MRYPDIPVPLPGTPFYKVFPAKRIRRKKSHRRNSRDQRICFSFTYQHVIEKTMKQGLIL